MTPAFFLHLIWSRRWLVLVVTLLTAATAYWTVLNSTERYTATTTLVLDFGEAGPFDQSPLPRQQNAAYLATQLDIIQSNRVADHALRNVSEEVLASLASEHLSEFNAQRYDEPDAWRRLIGGVLGQLQALTTRDSRVVALKFTSVDPDRAAEMVNSFAQAYIDTSLELAVEPARRNAQWFDEQLVSLRNRLVEKQAQLTAYQKEKGIISYDERLDTEMNRYESLSADLLRAQARTNEVRTSGVGTQHPEYVSAVRREAAARTAMDSQEQRLFTVKEERDELELLLQDVENARRSYDVALQEYYQTSMESQFNQTNVAILSPATTPTRSARPSIVSSIIGGVTLGLLFGILLAIAAELLNRRFRTEDDVTVGLELPVIAQI